MQEFVVVWNEKSYGDTEPQIVTITEFKDEVA